MREVILRLLDFSGAVSWAVLLGVLVVVGLSELCDWLRAVWRRRRTERIVQLASGNRATVYDWKREDEEIRTLERQLNRVWRGKGMGD